MIYFLEAIGLDAVKIGFAKDDVALVARIESLSCGCPVETKLLGVVGGDRSVERALHVKYRSARLRGEWFRASRVHEVLREWSPWMFRCHACGGPRAPSRHHDRKCRSCARSPMPLSRCGCGTTLSRRATHHHRSNGTAPRCRSCGQSGPGKAIANAKTSVAMRGNQNARKRAVYSRQGVQRPGCCASAPEISRISRGDAK